MIEEGNEVLMSMIKNRVGSLLRPVLTAQRVCFPDRSHRDDVWCPWCERVHHHGESKSELDAQCFDRGANSPLDGYIPSIMSRRAHFERAAFPDAPMLEISKFHRSIEMSANALRRALFTAIFLRKPSAFMKRSIAASKVVFTASDFGEWSIRFSDDGAIFGDEFLSFISKLYGIPRGVAAVRVLEATTNARFDATAALEIASAVDRWIERGAPKSEGRRA